MKRLALGAVALAAASASLGQSPQPTPRPPRFEAGIEIVNLTITVTDAQQRYVTGLRGNDFAVFEDGIRQDLTLFSHENLPVSLALMLDTSASMTEKIGLAQEAAVRFCRTLRRQDAARVVGFSDRATTLQDFTADPTALERAIRSTKAAGATALYNAIYVALKELGKQKKAGELRRRAIVLLSDGEDSGLSLVRDEEVLELARKTEIAIYAIGLRPNRPQDRNRLEFSQATHLLTALGRETGGKVYFPNSLSELDSVYDNIAEELRSQYNLGYVPSNPKRDGKWRRIVVKTPTRDDVQLRHRVGYYAPRG